MASGDFEYKKKEDIVDFIETLDKLEHFDIIKDIYKLLLQHNVHYTENQNGTYFRMVDLNDKVVDELIKFINFTKNNWKAIRLRQEEIQQVSINTVAEDNVNKSSQVDIKTEVEEQKTTTKSVEECPNDDTIGSGNDSIVAKKKKKSYNRTWNQMLKECKTK